MKINFLKWGARIIGMLAILFMLIFSFECFEGDYNLKEMLTCFIMHNIPVFILILLLIIAWRWELAGGLLYVAAAIAMTIYFDGFGRNSGVLAITAPFLLAGLLFILDDVRQKRLSDKNSQ